ncbi:MAG TPA: SHOCT domain-containing protein [Coriobacteriia bacterium]
MGPGLARMAFAPRGGGFGLLGGMGLGLIGLLLFLVFVGVVVWLLVKATKGRAPAWAASVPAAPSAPADSALAIVRERLARGEIDSEEYEKLVTVLDGTRLADTA